MLRKLLRIVRSRPDLSETERAELEREHARVCRQIEQVEADMGKVSCAGCVKEENPYHKRKIAELRALTKTLDDIEWKLGGPPPRLSSKSKRAQQRARKQQA